MQRKHNSVLVPMAKELRKNMTKEERHLWYNFLRGYSPRFLRQKILGRYIADFYCAEAKLVIELDGSQHYQEADRIKDEERAVFFNSYKILVIRIPNNKLNENFSGVCQYVDQCVKRRLAQGNNPPVS